MTTNGVQIPPGPSEKYSTAQELLSWMNENCRRYGEIYKASVYGTIVYVISSPEYAEQVLRKNWQNYKKGQAIKRIAFLLGNGLMVSEGGLWKHQRRMIQPAFHRNAIGALMGVIRTANTKLLKRWEQAAQKHESVNVTRDISLMVLEVVLIAIFGDEYEQVAPHFSILSDVTERNLEFAQKFRLLGSIIVQAADKRRKENIKSTDILGMLMEARDRENGEPMPTHQLINEIMTIIVAGHETTASTLNWTWYLLSQHPEVEEKLARELSDLLGNEFPDVNNLPKFTYTRQVLEEALRLYPPGWLMTRRALKDDQLGTYFVPAGTEIYVSPYFIQRHPHLWDAPDRFNPDRFDSHHLRDRHPLAMLPFSAGPRNCIGEHFARIEMQVHLMTIAKRLRLRYAEETPLGLDAGVNLRSKHDFIMTPEIKGNPTPESFHRLQRMSGQFRRQNAAIF
jgi:cytochrome P450